MDEFERRLRDDAARIRAEVSPALDARIRASLEAADLPARPARSSPSSPPPQWSSWWASSLTGLAVALCLIALVNYWPDTASPPEAPEAVARTTAIATVTPLLRAETAVLTAPLERELDDLEADLKKAREVVRADLGL